MKKGDEIKKDTYFIIFLDDDNSTKEKYAFIEEDDFWVKIQFIEMPNKIPYGAAFKIPKTRVLKIKEIGK